jgi:hypothetical protein
MLQFGLAMFEKKTAHQSIDGYFHATYFVVAKTHLQILQTLASACLALIYLAAARWVLHPLNNSLGLTHLVVATIGSVLLTVSLSAFVSLPSASGLSAIPTGKSLAASRVFRWSIVFPIGLRHARRELYVDRYHGFPVPVKADSRMVAKSNRDDQGVKAFVEK